MFSKPITKLSCASFLFAATLAWHIVLAGPAALGPTSYVSETARHLARPQLLWANQDYLQEKGFADVEAAKKNILKHYAIGIPGPGEPADAFTSEETTVFADRYGGTGIGDNWGSGRAAELRELAALLEAFQIKGIGQTSLVGNWGEQPLSNLSQELTQLDLDPVLISASPNDNSPTTLKGCLMHYLRRLL